MKKCCVAFVLLAATCAFGADRESARFIEFTGTVVDGHVARPAALWMESHQRARFDRLLSLRKSMRAALTASVEDPTLR